MKGNRTNLMKENRTNLMKENRTNLMKENRTNLMKENRTNLMKENRTNLMKENRTNLMKENRTNLMKGNRTNLMQKITLCAFACTLILLGCSEGSSVVNTPQKYEFTRDGKNTVDYSDQQTLLDMHSQLKDAVSLSTTETVTLNKLNGMFNHIANANNFEKGRVFDAETLNASSLNISEATAYSKDYKDEVKNQFKTWFGAVVENSNPTTLATKGTPGKLNRDAEGTRKILVDANGFEYSQVISKSLMGAMELDQIVNKYLSAEKLDVENDENEEGKDYTKMEHHWDQAFGYTALHINALDNNLVLERGGPNRRFWGGYIYAVNGLVAGKGIKDEIMTAFLRGREAIAVKNYEIRDEQAKIIKKLMSKVCAIRAAYYLNAGKLKLSTTIELDKASAFHAISEGYGFIYGLQFSNSGSSSPYFSKAEVGEMLTKLEADGGLYRENIETVLSDLATEIATKFDFKVADLNKIPVDNKE